VEDRLATLRAGKLSVPELDDLTKMAADWARDPRGSGHTADALLHRCELATPEFAKGARADWATLLVISATTSLSSLIAALSDSRKLAALVADPTADCSGFSPPRARRLRRGLHRDHGLAALSVAALAIAVLGCCAVWIATAWPEGSTAAQMAAIYAALYGSLDDPAPSLLSFALWTLASLPIAAVYLFAIFPAIDGFPMLVVTLAPAFLVMGYLQANPRHALKALALLIGVIGALDLQLRFSADFASFANVNSAEVVGISTAFLAMRIFRSITSASMARRLLRRGWRDLANLAIVRRPVDRDRWLGIMLDRLGLVTPRLELSGSEVGAEAGDALAALQIGLDLIDLKTAVDHLEIARSGRSSEVMAAIARISRARARGCIAGPIASHDVLSAIDASARETSAATSGPMRSLGLAALTGLRRTLFPDAPPFINETTS
jgi:uncharacterized membrane protein YccC